MLGRMQPTGPVSGLHQAMLDGNYEGFVFNLKDVSQRLGNAINADARIQDKEAALKAALARYVNKAEPNLNGQAAIHLVACFPQGDHEGADGSVLKTLLTHFGANPNAQDANGNTLMHHYASRCVNELTAYVKESQAKKLHNEPKEIEKCADIIRHYMIRICTLSYYKGDPHLTNTMLESPVGIMSGCTPGLEEEAIVCYQRALAGAVPPGKVEVNIPEKILKKPGSALAEPGVHLAKVLKDRANDNSKEGKAKKECVLQ